MRILSIALNGYKRFLLNGIDKFEMVMTADMQLIIGTNGSGKSSLISELSPLPAQHTDYTKQGSKVIRIEHHHQYYILSSVFGTKQPHSFLVGDTELNPGGTITVQRELVKEHFGLTQEIHELLIEVEKFDAMSLPRRKEWLLRLCDTNYDYAITVYNKFLRKHRDLVGALKLTKKTLVQESEKLLQNEELARLTQDAVNLHDTLSHLLEYRKPVEKDLEALERQAVALDAQLMQVSRQLTATYGSLVDNEQSAGDYADELQLTSEIVIRTQAIMAKLGQDHLATSEKINILQRAASASIQNLEEDRDKLLYTCCEKIKNSLCGKVVENAKRASEAFSAMRDTLNEIFTTIPNNKDKKYTQLGLVAAREKLEFFNLKKKNIVEAVYSNRASLKHMEAHMGKEDTACPKCDHRFSLNFNEEKYLALSKTTETLEEELASIVYPAIAEQEQCVEDCLTYGRVYRQYVQLTQASPMLSVYWDWLKECDLITVAPENGIHVFERIAQDLIVQIEIGETTLAAQKLDEILVSLKTVGTSDLNSLTTSLQLLEEELSAQTHLHQVASTRKNQCQAELNRRLELGKLRSKITSLIQAKRQINKEEIETHRRLVLNQLIRELQSVLATTEHTLNAAGAQKGIVDNLTARIESFGIEEQALTCLVKTLSPTEGLIAEGLLGFTKNFVDQMNAFIGKVWTYPLVIQSCSVVEGENVDLDYKFPMLINEGESPISDISKGSRGMKEIINLAFRLTAMQYLNLQDSALYLDEAGAAFDLEHRKTFLYALKGMIEQKTFSQIFLVSHDFMQYGAMTQSEYCVLNNTNVMVPEKYNQHVKMN